MAAATLSLCSSLTPKLSQNQASIPFSQSRTNLSFLSHSFSSLTLSSRKQPALSFTAKATDTEDAVAVSEPEIESPMVEIEPAAETPKPKREEIFAVVMVGGRQYIVFPGRYIYTQRLKGANVNDKVGGRQYIVFPGRYIYTQRLKGASVNDKVTLNKVLLVGTKTSTWIGKPIVPNAVVQAVVEEQTLDKKVIVFKYKKKKNYRRNIGHRQPITRIRITSIDGYQDSPFVTLDDLETATP